MNELQPTSIPEYRIDEDITLHGQETWPRSVHRFEADRRAVTALQAAEACGRPLLVRGSPGVGKSQLARAAAQAGERPFVSAVIDSRTQAHDLMWRLDAVRRLGDAQVLQQGQKLQPESDYIEPQALWWALDWTTAEDQICKYRQAAGLVAVKRIVPAGWQPGSGRAPVVLLDEIDKADPDLPNALLEVLANGGFRLPFAGEAVKAHEQRRPLVIITTNEERELPQAFLRRCLILTLELPKTEAEFVDYMVAMGQRHEPFWQGTCLVMEQAASRLWSRRIEAQRRQDYQPGTAEYLDLVSALANLWPSDAAEQERQLDLLEQFTFHKTQAAPR
jgi:MoxR-like ATPase